MHTNFFYTDTCKNQICLVKSYKIGIVQSMFMNMKAQTELQIITHFNISEDIAYGSIVF